MIDNPPEDNSTSDTHPAHAATNSAQRRKKLGLAVAGVAVVAAVVITLVITLAGNKTSHVQMSGQILVTQNGGPGEYAGQPCPTDNNGPNADVTIGSEVDVYSSSGTIIGQGAITASLSQRSPIGSPDNDCAYSFTVANLPSSPFYQVEVGNRGKVTVTKAEASDVSLTLGN